MNPPQDLDERIKVVGLEETEKYPVLILDAFHGHVNECLTIDRYYLTEVFNFDAPMTRKEIQSYMPFLAQVHIKGQTIASMTEVQVLSTAQGIQSLMNNDAQDIQHVPQMAPHVVNDNLQHCEYMDTEVNCEMDTEQSMNMIPERDEEILEYEDTDQFEQYEDSEMVSQFQGQWENIDDIQDEAIAMIDPSYESLVQDRQTNEPEYDNDDIILSQNNQQHDFRDETA